MVELFKNVSEKVKSETKFWFEICLLKNDPKEAAKILLDFQKTLQTEEEKDYVDFYFNMRMLQLREEKLNEGNSNQW